MSWTRRSSIPLACVLAMLVAPLIAALPERMSGIEAVADQCRTCCDAAPPAQSPPVRSGGCCVGSAATTPAETAHASGPVSCGDDAPAPCQGKCPCCTPVHGGLVLVLTNSGVRLSGADLCEWTAAVTSCWSTRHDEPSAPVPRPVNSPIS